MMVSLCTTRAFTTNRMPFEGLYTFPLEGPPFDFSVVPAADDGILVDGEGIHNRTSIVDAFLFRAKLSIEVDFFL